MGVDRLVLSSVIARAAGGGEGFDAFREGARSRLLLWGRLPALWAGNLALHAYAAGFEDMMRRVPDVSKLEKLTGFRPRTPLDHTIRDVLADQEQQLSAAS